MTFSQTDERGDNMRIALISFVLSFVIGIAILVTIAVTDYFFGPDWAAGMFFVWVVSLMIGCIMVAAENDV
jgi:hypothetical protein